MSAAAPPVAPLQGQPVATLDRPPREGSGGWIVGVLLAFGLVIGAYYTVRFGGRWSESDTGLLALSIRAAQQEGTLLPSSGEFYGSGYAFTAVSVFLLALTGADTGVLVQLVYPLISASLVVAAWPLYRELTGSARAATLATLLLFTQPEFLFVVLRGSHERILRLLILVSLLLLVRTIHVADRPRVYSTNVLLFYLAVYGLVATNSLFGSSFAWALVLALAASWFGKYLGPGLGQAAELTGRRLIYAPLMCVVIAFIFNDFIYPPAAFGGSQVPTIFERAARLFLTVNPEGAPPALAEYDPYAAVAGQWIDVRIYFLIASGTYLLMAGSVVIWVRTALRWLARKGDPPTPGQWLLWLLYASFALQGGLSIIADRTGVFGGNLQHRSFPSFAMVAIPVVASTVAHWRPRPRLHALGGAALGLLALFAVVKATNEPAVSNVWTFYVPAEVAAMQFVDRHVKEAAYWAEFDDRLVSAMRVVQGATAAAFGPPDSGRRTYLLSELTRLRSARLGRQMPPVAGELRVYDNGVTQVYHLRSYSPYQD